MGLVLRRLESLSTLRFVRNALIALVGLCIVLAVYLVLWAGSSAQM
jgi:hypothetical protein